jgi:hypothetical protein
MALTLHEIMDAINACPELRGNHRRSKVVSAIAEALAEDDYDEPALETVLDAATDFGITLTFTRVCIGCLADCPFDQDRCDTCRAEAIRDKVAADVERDLLPTS